VITVHFNYKVFYAAKAVETTKQKEEKRETPKPEEKEGMPHQYCPPLVPP
jgi:hypothetical protein